MTQDREIIHDSIQGAITHYVLLAALMFEYAFLMPVFGQLFGDKGLDLPASVAAVVATGRIVERGMLIPFLVFIPVSLGLAWGDAKILALLRQRFGPWAASAWFLAVVLLLTVLLVFNLMAVAVMVPDIARAG